MLKKISKGKERLFGAVFSYANTTLNMVITILLVPILLKICGESDYSVYKVMSSFAAPLSIINFGISVYVARGIAKCNEEGGGTENLNRQRILGMSLIISAILFAIAIAVSAVFFFLIDPIYGNTFTAGELKLAKILFAIMAFNIAFHIVDNGFNGCLIGNESFITLHGINFLRSLLKCAIIAVLVFVGCTVTAVAAMDLILTVLAMIGKILYIKLSLNEKYCLTGIQKAELKVFFIFSAAMILQVIVNNINQTMDNVILGALISDKSIITMYSSALSINTVFISFSYVFSGVYSTKIMRAVIAEDSKEVLTKKAIEPAKYQAIFSSLLCFGFVLFGHNFIELWIGNKYINAYYVCLALMIPAYFVSITGIYEAFLDAKLKRLTRSLILFGMAIYNAAVSIVLVPHVGYWGAAFGTASSFIVGNIIVMNLYAAKVSGVSAIKIYVGAFSGIWKAILLSSCVGIVIGYFLPNSLVWFAVKIVSFIAIYGLSVWFIGLKKNERSQFANVLKRKKD